MKKRDLGTTAAVYGFWSLLSGLFIIYLGSRESLRALLEPALPVGGFLVAAGAIFVVVCFVAEAIAAIRAKPSGHQ